MVFYIFGYMGFPPLSIGAIVFMVHCGGKPLVRAQLKSRVRKGARHSWAYIMCSTHKPMWSMDFLCSYSLWLSVPRGREKCHHCKSRCRRHRNGWLVQDSVKFLFFGKVSLLCMWANLCVCGLGSHMYIVFSGECYPWAYGRGPNIGILPMLVLYDVPTFGFLCEHVLR